MGNHREKENRSPARHRMLQRVSAAVIQSALHPAIVAAAPSVVVLAILQGILVEAVSVPIATAPVAAAIFPSASVAHPTRPASTNRAARSSRGRWPSCVPFCALVSSPPAAPRSRSSRAQKPASVCRRVRPHFCSGGPPPRTRALLVPVTIQLPAPRRAERLGRT